MLSDKLKFLGVAIVALVILAMSLTKLHTVSGNEIGVRENYWSGVVEEPLTARTYFLFRPTNKIYNYPQSLQLFVMNDNESPEEIADGRTNDAYLVQSSDSQDMRISFNIQWHLDPRFVIRIHREVRSSLTNDDLGAQIGDRLVRPVAMNAVKNKATMLTAVEAYAGASLVQLQKDILKDLQDPTGPLATRGVLVDNFVIEQIKLDDKYKNEINGRQIAMVKKSRAEEETKAATAMALTAEAIAQADYKKQVVEAERDKQVGILRAEKEKQQQILGAEAEREKQVLLATGAKDAALLEAEGTLARGKADAEAQRLRLSSYAVPGADAFVKIEVAKAMAQSTKGIQGYLPADMNAYVMGGNFKNLVEAFSAK